MSERRERSSALGNSIRNLNLLNELFDEAAEKILVTPKSQVASITPPPFCYVERKIYYACWELSILEILHYILTFQIKSTNPDKSVFEFYLKNLSTKNASNKTAVINEALSNYDQNMIKIIMCLLALSCLAMPSQVDLSKTIKFLWWLIQQFDSTAWACRQPKYNEAHYVD